MADKNRVDKVIRHAGIITDFWLGVAAAGLQGAAAALGKPAPDNAPEKTLDKRVEDTVDRAARGFKVAFDGARRAAQFAEQELAHAHGKGPPDPPRKGPGGGGGDRATSVEEALYVAAQHLSDHPEERREVLASLYHKYGNGSREGRTES
jgi:hypothetical protein